jgi:hypothetical protein
LPQVRNKDISEIDASFDSATIKFLESKGILEENKYQTISELFRYELFKNMRNRWTNFSKYVLMRIDRYFAEKLDKPSYCRDTLEHLEERFNKNNQKKYGMHLEHIYARNDRNLKLFKDENGVFDENLFGTTRNMLGVVLLLKDKQNISSNNDYYSSKVEDYSTSNIIWNELLVGHIDSIDIKNLPFSISNIKPNQNGAFPLEMIETRQKELFEVIKLIWKDR